MMKREGSVRTLEIIKECADTAGECTISLEQAEKAMEIEQLGLKICQHMDLLKMRTT